MRRKFLDPQVYLAAEFHAERCQQGVILGGIGNVRKPSSTTSF